MRAKGSVEQTLPFLFQCEVWTWLLADGISD
jgi:hypothetical protein